MAEKFKKILLIGPLPNLKANKIGGARVAFSYLHQYLIESKRSFDFINSRKHEIGLGFLWNPFYILFTFLTKVSKADIVFINVSHGGAKTLAPIFYCLSKLFKKEFVFRVFGGRLKQHYQNYTTVQKWVFHKTIFKSDVFFVETKALYTFFHTLGTNAAQLLNARDAVIPDEPNFQKRFVFLGHIKSSKGIDQILEARKHLDDSYTIHLYGPIKEKRYHFLKENSADIYQGKLNKEDVIKKLNTYDVLILPTYFEGEGHPGAIIEAYSLGLPVITTNWLVIPEIVQPNQTGLLIAPQSSQALIEAIQFFNTTNYTAFSKQALTYFNANFETSKVMEEALDLVETTNQKK